MGNRLGGQKSSKPKEEKKREKEHTAKREKEDEKTKKKTTKKEKKENKIKKKEKAKKVDGKSKQSSNRGGAQNSGSELDTDLESSHMTGWDSESGVFHSAENISSSPYLDSHTRSELEHSGTWSSLYESSASRHPHVLCSRDFRDGFSLEACIPPEIARRDTSYHDQDGASGGGGSGSNVFSYSNSGSQKSKRSNSTKSSRSRMTPTSGRHHADDLMSVSTSSSQKSGPMGREGYSTPLLTTPVFGRVDRSHSPIASGDVSSALSRVHEADRDSMDIVSQSPFDPNAKVYTTYNPPAHLAHLYQRPSQTIDYRNLPKPTSPHPQRRALSPKMTSPSFKLISSDDSSSSPSTPVPQRKAGNILAELLRSGRGSGDKKKQKKLQAAMTSESDDNVAGTQTFKSELAQAEEIKKSKGLSMWKTWERSSKKKSDKTSKISIFGTSRKRNKKSESKKDPEGASGDGETLATENKNTDRMSDSTLKDLNLNTGTGSVIDKVDRAGDKRIQRTCKTTKSSTSSYENSSSRGASDVDYWGDKNRNSSPPVAKSAAFCIMRLEELERNIEKTIREKFPDAEPFLIRKRTPPDDSSRGSKSLPTTPSPKKKVFVSHDKADSCQKEVTSTLTAASNKLGDVVGATRYYDETFEESASPVMSPVVLRRFGARTRHASISPKIQRAKTAALYNSPSEMERVAECSTPLSLESPPNESIEQQHPPTITAAHSTMSTTTAPTTHHRSFQNHGHQLVRQRRIELSESEEETAPSSHFAQHRDHVYQSGQTDKAEKGAGKGGVDTYSFDKPVIVPSFSAVFGSVSPKLKRHLKLKQVGANQTVDGDHRLVKGGSSGGKLISLNQRCESLESASLKNSGSENRQGFTAGSATGKDVKDTQRSQYQQQLGKTTTMVTSGQSTASSPSVGESAANIMRTVSETRGGSGEGGGGYPPPSNARALEQVTKWESNATDSTSPKPGWPNSDSHLRSADTKQRSETAGKTKESPVTSPGTGRKHSTDHVIFGSPVALPCRLYSKSTSPPSSPERRKGTNNNNEHPASNFDYVLHTHAQSNARGVHERNVKRCQGQFDVSSNTPPSTQFKHVQGSTKLLSDRLAESERGVSCENVSLSDEHIQKCQRDDPITGDVIDKGDKYNRVDPDPTSGSDFSRNSSASAPNEKAGSVKNNFQRHSPKGRNDNKVFEDEQPVIVLKQPVSKVISDMINSSKQKQKHQHQQKQQQQQQDRQHEQLQIQQQQQQRNWQASPTSPDKDAIHVEPAFAMVTAPSFQQACLALEEKHVVSGSSCAPSSRGVTSLMEDKEEFLSADGITETCSGGNDLECSQVRTPGLAGKPAVPGSSGDTSEGSDLDRFLKNVKASEKLLHSKPEKEMQPQSSMDDVKQNPPPPSPTAVEKVSEILEEDEEEEEVEEEIEITRAAAVAENAPRKEVNLALVRHNEMREFSDKVCQRLSDLLSSHTGSDEVFVGTDWKEDDEENDEKDKEDVFVENAQIKERSYDIRDDLQEHWDDPGLLSELSESNILEPQTKAKTAKDHTPAGDIRRSQFSTSSSLSTSTSSSSSSFDLFAPPSLPPSGRHDVESTPKRKIDQEYFSRRKHEGDNEYFDDDSRDGCHANSRCYHSDDDVARGGGIPDYYDDRPLWKKRQKPPGQISIALAATRRRERRERWLKKRRRNRTDLVSTGSSDMGSQNSLKQDSRLFRGDSTGSCEYEEDEEVTSALTSQRRAMGSGILCSPKYSKPIMPFLGSGEIRRPNPPLAQEEIITPEKVASHLTATCRSSREDEYDVDDSWDKDSSTISRSTDTTLCDDHNKLLDTPDELDDHRSSLTSTEQTTTTATTSTTGSHSHLAIPGLEETFDELLSVKQILEELQDRTPGSSANVSKTDASKQSLESLNNAHKTGDGKFMPLTVENIKSMKELYKDSSGNGRRSRMSNTDRTESDLDLFSEYRDDASTDSNLYADDEEDDDNNEPYATADDDVGGTTGGDEVENFVVSCTFYNSNSTPLGHVNDKSKEGTHPGPLCGDSESASVSFHDDSLRNNNSNGEVHHNRLVRSTGASSYGRSNSAPGSRSGGGNQFSLAHGASASGYNSDEEFWAGRAAFERSYQQLESAAGAVSSTFQNAREQMMDIQQHLQALRRQMEGLQDDLTSTSYTLTPDFSALDSK